MMQPWFREARLGIFLHWGIYSVAGVEASWAFFQHGTADAAQNPAGVLPYEEYMALARRFTAAEFDARLWARWFKSIGARYVVLTAKHHDGVALWETATSPLTIQQLAPAGVGHPDIMGEFCAAMRAEGLRVGIYFSHADWSHPDYATVFREGMAVPAQVSHERAGAARFSYPGDAGSISLERWERFKVFHRAQIRELCERYRPDLLWFDGAHERSARQWGFAELLRDIERWCPGVVINSRIGDRSDAGDYDTPEQVLPIGRAAYPPIDTARPFEFCTTLNHQWGYSADRSRLKPAHHLSRLMMETAGLGGNLLLNIGPREDGTFDPEQTARLNELGDWSERNGEVIFGTMAGLSPGHVYGATTVSADRRTLYVCLFDGPARGDFAVKGVRNKVLRARRVDTGTLLAHHVDPGAPWHNIPGTIWVQFASGEALDAMGTVIALELEGALDVWE